MFLGEAVFSMRLDPVGWVVRGGGDFSGYSGAVS